MAKVFISSTSRDLADYREAAINTCNRIEFVPLAMEFFEAMGKGATKGSIDKLKEADVYVGIFANRYGYIEEGQSKSVTEIEFDTALELGLEPLCFFFKSDYPLAKVMCDDEHHSQLEIFHKNVNKKFIRNEFTTIDDFKARLYQALSQWQKRHPETPILEKVLDIFAQRRAFFQGDKQAIKEFTENMQYGDAGRALFVAHSFAEVVSQIESTLSTTSSRFHPELKQSISKLIVDCKDYRDNYGGEYSGGQRNWDFKQIQKRYNLAADDSFKVFTTVIEHIIHSFKDLLPIRLQAVEVIERILSVDQTLKTRCDEIKGIISKGIDTLRTYLGALDRTLEIVKEIGLTSSDFKIRKNMALKKSQSEKDETVSSLLKALSAIPE